MVLPTVLFVCARNAGASLMAEAYLNTIADGAVRAFSAGIEPAGRADPRALRAITAAGVPTDGLAPKPIELFAMPTAPEPDVLVLLSRQALAREPQWTRPPRRLVWLVSEPEANAGTPAFARLFDEIARRIERALAGGVFGAGEPLRHAG